MFIYNNNKHQEILPLNLMNERDELDGVMEASALDEL